jgi:putative membrane protein
MRVEELFGGTAFDAIEHAVQAAEQRTSGEIVPMIVQQSHDYAGVRAAAAALVAFAAGACVLAAPISAALWLPPAQLAAFALGYWIVGHPRVLRVLLPQRRADWAVERAARLAFFEGGLVETRDRTGILIYISLVEHRVVVLADRGIDERVEPGTWDGVVARILSGIRERKAEAGLIEAIGLCGELLAASFPPRHDDTDELSNRPRT